MSVPSTCPPPERLRLLFDNQLPPGERAELTAHVSGCSECRKTLEALASGSAMDMATIAPTSPPQPLEESLVRALQALSTQPGQTIGGGSKPRDEWVFSFLSTSSVPGNLGRLGNYEIQDVIGKGGMGIVLKGFDPSLNRHVAIKVLAPHLASDQTARQRFAREAKSAAAVHHENVVTIHAVAEANGMPFIVMEYVAGESLHDYLERHGPLDTISVIRIGAQTAAGLAAAHAQGLVHRDIKPANLLLEMGNGEWGMGNEEKPPAHSPFAIRHSPLGRVKITDFGLARAADDTSLTQSGVVAGTPMYMSPEQAMGEAVTPRADLYSLGSVLYALCSGAPPFRSGTPMAVLKQVCDAEPPPIRKLNANVPPWLAEVIVSLHAKNPEQRFPSASELADLLRQHLAHLEEPTRIPPPPDSTHRLRRLRRPFRIRRLLIGLAVTTLVLAGILTFFLTRPTTPRLQLIGHERLVRAVAFSPDGEVLATCGNDTTLRLWSPVTGEEAGPPRSFNSTVMGLAIRGDGLLAAGSEVGAVKLWTGDPLAHEMVAYCHKLPCRALAFSPDGQTLAVASGKNVELLDVAELLALGPRANANLTLLTKHTTLTLTRAVSALAYSPDGETLVTADARGDLKVWTSSGTPASGPQPPEHAHDGAVRALVFHPDGAALVSGGEDRTIKIWNRLTWQSPDVLHGHGNGVLTLAFSPNGAVLASAGNDETVKLWDFKGRRERTTLHGHHGAVLSVAFSPDGGSLASAGEDMIVRIWDVGRWTRR